MSNTKAFFYATTFFLAILVASCSSDDCITCENSTTGVTTEVCDQDSLVFTDINGNEISWANFRQSLIDSGECTE